MAVIGYARVSTTDQKLDLQIDALQKLGCDIIFSEKVSAVKQRDELDKCLAYLRRGDTLAVYKIDRLGRSLKMIINTIHDLNERGIELKSISENIDTTTPQGRMQIGMVSTFAQFEREIIKERCRDGIASAKEKGIILGRKKGDCYKVMDGGKTILLLYNNGMKINEIVSSLKVTKATVYNYLKKNGIKPERYNRKNDEKL